MSRTTTELFDCVRILRSMTDKMPETDIEFFIQEANLHLEDLVAAASCDDPRVRNLENLRDRAINISNQKKRQRQALEEIEAVARRQALSRRRG